MSWQGTDHTASLPKALLEAWALGKALQGSGHSCAISLRLELPQGSCAVHCLWVKLFFSMVRKWWTVQS